jgi:hypothetical protein
MAVTAVVAWLAPVSSGRPTKGTMIFDVCSQSTHLYFYCSMKYVTIWANMWWTACGARFSFVFNPAWLHGNVASHREIKEHLFVISFSLMYSLMPIFGTMMPLLDAAFR